MTENIRKLLELISGNAELTARLNNASKEDVIALAKELGITLTDADFDPPENGEISENELETVSGGKQCYCYMGGGGTASEGEKTCACVLYGHGNWSNGSMRCTCPCIGDGWTD